MPVPPPSVIAPLSMAVAPLPPALTPMPVCLAVDAELLPRILVLLIVTAELEFTEIPVPLAPSILTSPLLIVAAPAPLTRIPVAD